MKLDAESLDVAPELFDLTFHGFDVTFDVCKCGEDMAHIRLDVCYPLFNRYLYLQFSCRAHGQPLQIDPDLGARE